MKKLVLLPVCLLVLTASLWPVERTAPEPPLSFRIVQCQFIALGWVDFSMTSYALATGQFQEKNPLARAYAHNPALSITLNLAGEGFLFWGTTQVWKSNKTLGWIMLISFTAARAYVLYRNIKTMREHYQ